MEYDSLMYLICILSFSNIITSPLSYIIFEDFFQAKYDLKISSIIIVMEIGKVIIQLRKEHNISQTELGKAIGVSARAISYWEQGINEPKATYIAELSKFFGVSSDYLLGLED